MKRVLLDQGIAPSVARILRENGFDAIHVAEIGMDTSEDILIPARALEENRTCVTLDHDFHAHLALSKQVSPSVVLLRVQGLDAARQAELIRAVCVQCEQALAEGAAVSADVERIRVRRLPLR